jgi:DNA-directed RNA polymerase specialized sigma24 family protein
MPAIRDEEYAAEVERERPLIQATAYLLAGDPVQAERLVQLAFAQLYGRWPRVRTPHVEAIRAVVTIARRPVTLPWEHRPRVELIDGFLAAPPVQPIMADLRLLSHSQRVAIVLERYVGMPDGQIAEILQRPVGEVALLGRQAQAVLTALDPARTSDQALAQELRDAIPYEISERHSGVVDLVHGRRLARRRWTQRCAAALVAVMLVAVATVLLITTRQPVPQAGPALSSEPVVTPPGQSCDTADATCRTRILLKWRYEMVEIVTSHLDPKGKYFSGFGYYYDDRYDTPGFWYGQEGALAFEMFRLDRGATEVYLQIASSRKFAVRCGATTRQPCSRIKVADGNFFVLSESTGVREGIEVQYSPSGKEVITVIARNTQRGHILNINQSDLIKLVQDTRLHLPKR